MVCPNATRLERHRHHIPQDCNADGNDYNPFAIVQQHILAHQYVKTGRLQKYIPPLNHTQYLKLEKSIIYANLYATYVLYNLNCPSKKLPSCLFIQEITVAYPNLPFFDKEKSLTVEP
jgi:hypothetical protein